MRERKHKFNLTTMRMDCSVEKQYQWMVKMMMQFHSWGLNGRLGFLLFSPPFFALFKIIVGKKNNCRKKMNLKYLLSCEITVILGKYPYQI